MSISSGTSKFKVIKKEKINKYPLYSDLSYMYIYIYIWLSILGQIYHLYRNKIPLTVQICIFDRANEVNRILLRPAEVNSGNEDRIPWNTGILYRALLIGGGVFRGRAEMFPFISRA